MAEGVVRYRFLSLVGEGGFGKVYRARMEAGDGFHKDVAIKVLNDPHPPKTLLERFRDEAKILGLLRDRAIVSVEPPIRIGEQWAVVMEFVDGVSCGTMLDRLGVLPPGVAVEIVGEVARALHTAFHMEGPEGDTLELLHRDIKPENVQITPAGDVRLLDFGIARAKFAAREFKTRHSLGGTPGYIAPERLQRVEVPQGDVYSLGVVLHELITGDRPKFPPTVEIGTIEQEPGNNATFFSSVLLDDADLELDGALAEDEHVMEVLRLAGWMRAYEPENRPTARQVEEACRELRRKLPPPYFRDWAEQHIPHRMELEGDAMVGRVLSTHIGLSLSYEDAASGARPTQPMGTPSAPPANPTAQTGSRSMAMGAMLGGGVVALLTGGGVLAFAVGLAVAFLLGDKTDDLPEPGLPANAGLPTAQVVAPQVVPPTPPPQPEPAAEVAPQPVPPKAPPRERRVLDLTKSPSAGSAEPAPSSVVVPQRKRPTGFVMARSVPSGATLWLKGEALSRSGRGYELPIGSHTLEMRNATGESYRFVVNLRADQTVTICYDFDTNRACSGP